MTTTTTKTTIPVQGTRYPLIRLTAKKALDVCGMHINQGEIFFLVKSRKGSQEYLPVRWNYERKCWQCSCKHGCEMHKHVALCSKFSSVHPYSKTHSAGCPKVVKSEQAPTKELDTFIETPVQSISPEVASQAQVNSPLEPAKITEVEKGAWYIVNSQFQVWFAEHQWHCSCGEYCSGHISDVKALLASQQSDREPRELALETAARKRRTAKDRTHLHLVTDECYEIKERAATAV